MTTVQKPIIMTIDGAVMKLQINRPQEQNGLNWEALELLADAYQRAIDDKTLRVIVITGNHEYFHTGGRVNVSNAGEQKKYSAGIERMQRLQDELTIPMIAAVSGDCLKGGMGLLADADIAVARRGVHFGFPEVRMGGVPMMVMASTISIPKKRALEAYYSSEYFDADEAFRMGLVNCVASDEEFWDTVQHYIDMIVSKPRELIEMTRAAYYRMIEMPGKKERKNYAMDILENHVLTTMASGKTEYNI